MADMQADKNSQAAPTNSDADCSCFAGACCGPAAAEGARSGASGGRWKTAAFAVVMLLAAGVAAHSLVTRQSAADEQPVPGRAALAAPVALEQDAADDPGLATIEDVEAAFEGRDFLFVVLPGPDEAATRALERPLADAAARIRTRDVNVGTFVLSRESPDFAEAIENFGIEQFPTVLALKWGCGVALVQGQVTEEKLLRAYLKTCVGTASCAPGACGP